MRIQHVLGGFALSLLSATSSLAQTEDWSGELHGEFNDITNANLSSCAPSIRVQESWDFKYFLAGSDGPYVISVTSAIGMPGDSGDALMALYHDPFTGSWPVNCLEVDDDTVGVLPQITINLTAGIGYVVLVTYAYQGVGDGDGALYTARIVGPRLFGDGFESGDYFAWNFIAP